MSLTSGFDELAEKGLNWLAAVQPHTLTNPRDAGIDLIKPDAAVLLFFAFGPLFGRQTMAQANDGDMFDRRSRNLALDFAKRYLDDVAPLLLYPASNTFILAPWLAAARVCYRSPLGLGIRPDVGLWLAVRAVLLVTLSQQQLEQIHERYPPLDLAAPSPCELCQQKPCLSACPAEAIHATQNFSGERCATYRLSIDSSCAQTCLARLACPLGAGARYDAPQLAYHYRLSLNTIRAWKAKS